MCSYTKKVDLGNTGRLFSGCLGVQGEDIIWPCFPPLFSAGWPHADAALP